MRPLISMVLSVSVVFLTVPHAAARFTDVPETHPQVTAIGWAESQGIVSGYPDPEGGPSGRSFGPEKLINRAEFTKIVTVAAYGEQHIQEERMTYRDTHDFTDVPEDTWFYPYVLFAWQNGIVSGHSDRTFRPATNVNFAEASKILVNSFSVPYTKDMGTEWWESFVNGMRDARALPSTFRTADQFVTRAEMVHMIYMLKLNQAVSSASISSAESTTSHSSVSSSSVLSDQSSSILGPGKYLDYKRGVIGNGERSILFFYATWCPYCRANDARLTEWYRDEGFVLTTYKLDYDKEKTLRDQFEVTTQDTFILIDEGGKEVDRVSFPSESMLRELLNR